MARQYYKDSTTGQMKPIGVKVEDTLPVGTEVDYDGTDIPEGWVEVDEIKNVNYNDYLSIDNSFTINIASAVKYGKFVIITLDISGTFSRGQTVLGSCTNLLAMTMHGVGRFTTNEVVSGSYLSIPCDIIAIKNGALRVYSNAGGNQISVSLTLLVTD